MRIDFTRIEIWWKTAILGVSAELLLKEAVRRGEFRRAHKVQDVTGAELDEDVIALVGENSTSDNNRNSG